MRIRLQHHFSVVCVLVLALVACVPSDKAPLPKEKEWVTGPLPPIGESFDRLTSSISSAIADARAGLQTSSSPSREMKVAVLLPLSGRSADVGKQMLDAAALAVVDANVSQNQTVSVVLVPKDTTTSATLAQSAANEALAQGAGAVVGPLFSQSVTEVAKVTAPRHVPVVALTNNRQVAQAGVSIFGFAPEDQVRRISDYALMQGITSIALIAPNDVYGQVVAETLKANITPKGGTVDGVEMYGKRPANVVSAAERLAASYKNKPFKALLIADSQAHSEILLKTLRDQGVDLSAITLLGTALWEDASPPYSPLLAGGVYATTDPGATTAFVHRFKAIYGYEPKKIAGLAYDAVRLIAERGTTISGDGLGSATGAYRIDAGGVTSRSLAVMKLTPTGATVLSPAMKKLEP